MIRLLGLAIVAAVAARMYAKHAGARNAAAEAEPAAAEADVEEAVDAVAEAPAKEECAAEEPEDAPACCGKAVNPLTVKGKGTSVKLARAEKAPQTVSRIKILNVSKAQGTVSYEKTGGSRKITVDSKTGCATVRKGIKKGTYRVSVRVNAAGNSKYARGSKTAAFKIIVQ